MTENQEMINQINGILSFLSAEDKKKLPASLVKYFSDKANVPPNLVISPEKSLNEQKLTDETLLMLAYINKYLTKRTN